MNILAFDTATEACTVALWRNQETCGRIEIGVSHSERILPMVQEVLSEAQWTLGQLDAIAFGRGPGSFTGLRIGASVAQGLAFGSDLPVVPVSSLAALAQGQEGDRILAAFDARMQQIYWSIYLRNAEGLFELQGVEAVLDPTMVPLPESQNWIGAGSGWDQYHAQLVARLGSRLTGWQRCAYPHAVDIARLGAAGMLRGQAVAPEHALPIYIRDEVAVKQTEG